MFKPPTSRVQCLINLNILVLRGRDKHSLARVLTPVTTPMYCFHGRWPRTLLSPLKTYVESSNGSALKTPVLVLCVLRKITGKKAKMKEAGVAESPVPTGEDGASYLPYRLLLRHCTCWLGYCSTHTASFPRRLTPHCDRRDRSNHPVTRRCATDVPELSGFARLPFALLMVMTCGPGSATPGLGRRGPPVGGDSLLSTGQGRPGDLESLPSFTS